MTPPPLKALESWHAEPMAREGWVAHGITDQPLVHTHSLAEHFDYSDLEMRLSVDPSTRYQCLATVAEAVTAGQRLIAGTQNTTLFSCPIRLIERKECDRTVLRVVFPDPQGRFPEDPGCPAKWTSQLIQDSDPS